MPKNFEREHEGIFSEATRIYKDKSHARGQMWLETGIRRELEMMREKLNRAEAAYERIEHHETVGDLHVSMTDLVDEFEDSILDGMNFANFAIKKFRRGIRE
jgi:hypothetical protein